MPPREFITPRDKREELKTYRELTLRRELIDPKLLARKSDCSEYWKLPARPEEETRALLAAWRARVRGEGPPLRVHRPRPVESVRPAA